LLENKFPYLAVHYKIAGNNGIPEYECCLT